MSYTDVRFSKIHVLDCFFCTSLSNFVLREEDELISAALTAVQPGRSLFQNSVTDPNFYLFSLGGWSRLLPTRFLVSRRTQETLTTQFAYLYGNFTLFVCAFHHILVHLPFVSRVPTTPYFYGLGSFPFARRYSENHFCFLFLQLLRCFSSPGCSPYKYG